MTPGNYIQTVTPPEHNSIDVVEDNSFSYDGYQVVRGEFFAHIHEPSFTFNNNKVYLNMACIRKLPQTEYVQILVHPEEKDLPSAPAKRKKKIHSVGVLKTLKNAGRNRSPAAYSMQKSSHSWDGIRNTGINCSVN